jgi:fluoride exporter
MRRRGTSPADLGRIFAVMVGGAVGALARWSVGLAFAASSTAFPWSTFVVNATGAFGSSFIAVLLTERILGHRMLRPLIAVGFFGAYTTFSTMAVEGVKLIDGGQVRTAALYWLATLIVGQLAGVYGLWVGRLIGAHGRREG